MNINKTNLESNELFNDGGATVLKEGVLEKFNALSQCYCL